MPATTAATFTGIHNENEFYSHHYLSEIFSGDIRATVDRWRDAADAEGGRTPYAALRALATDYVRFRRDFDRERRSELRLTLQREWFRQLLPALGYEWSPANHPLDDGDEVPVLCAAGGKAGAPALFALGAYDAEAEGEDPLALRPHRSQFHGEAPPPEALLRETWNDVVTRRLFGQDHPPRWLLVLSFSRVLLIERGKWTHNRLLRFDLDEILGRREDATRVQFPVMRQYEADTWYDAAGRIAFTVSKGLSGVGLPRKAVKGDTAWTLGRPGPDVQADAALGWEDVRGLREGVVTRRIMDDTLPGGPVERVIEYHAPFDRCDREEDYRAAWAAFRQRFGPSDGEPGAVAALSADGTWAGKAPSLE